MSPQSDDTSTFEKSFDLLKDYAETRISVFKLQFIRGAARMRAILPGLSSYWYL